MCISKAYFLSFHVNKTQSKLFNFYAVNYIQQCQELEPKTHSQLKLLNAHLDEDSFL